MKSLYTIQAHQILVVSDGLAREIEAQQANGPALAQFI